MSALIVGLTVVSLGTSAPELMVSALAAGQGNPGLALGNAYGANIANIGLILGLVALISPLAVHSGVIRRELPVLGGVTLLSALLMWGGVIGRWEGGLLLVLLVAFMGFSIFRARRDRADPLAAETEESLEVHPMSLRAGLAWTGIGLVLLFQNIFRHWESMSYFWTLIIMFVGVGIYIMGWHAGDANQKQSGWRVMKVGFVLFIIFGAFFEMIFSSFSNVVFPILLILLGAYLVLTRSGLFGGRKDDDSANTPVPPASSRTTSASEPASRANCSGVADGRQA